MNTDITTLLLADDHQVFIDGVRALLSDYSEFKVIAEALDGQESVRQCGRLKPDIAILDIGMPKLNGLEALKKIKKESPNTKIVLLSMNDSRHYIMECFKEGASGYLLKNVGQEELITALRKIKDGKQYYSSEIMTIMMQSQEEDEQLAKLSDKDKTIIKMIAQGETNQDIADKVFLSARAVESRRRNILSKLGLSNTAELIRYAVQHNLV